MMRKSGLKQIKKFNQFVKKSGNDIGRKTKDKTTSNTLDKKIATYESDRYLSDDEIKKDYEDYKITHSVVYNVRDDGGASGVIEIQFDDDNVEGKVVNWLKYSNDIDEQDGNIVFDYWYPEKMANQLKKFIRKEIKKEKIRREAEKYNI